MSASARAPSRRDVPELSAPSKLLLALGLFACASAPRPAPERAMTEDTPIVRERFELVVPKGWWLAEGDDALTLEDPERTLTAIVTERPERDGSAAIAAAWAVARPQLALTPSGPPRRPPPGGGWDAATTIAYDTSPGRAAFATARRWRDTTWVALVEGDLRALDRRGAQLDTALDSLRPHGMEEESFLGQALRPLDPKALDTFIGAALARLEVPGAAIAVLAGGKPVYERVLGVRELGQVAPVTTDTLFLLASITKPLTTLMEAALVDRGLLRWETPVTELLPGFALKDAEVTRSLSLWHMSCACTGMPRQDLEDIFEYGEVTPEARIASMASMAPTTGFGETFQYSNLMVAAGGFAAARAYAPTLSLGEAYAKAMRDSLFAPIGMTSTTLDFAAVARADHAVPHALALDGATRPMPLSIERAVIPIAPAGGVWTSLRDFERYAQTELARGLSPEGRRVASEANVTARYAPRVRSGARDAYGLGIDVSELGGLRVLAHDGGAFGFGTTLFMLPELGLAILILTNVRNGGPYAQLPFNRVVLRAVIEQLFERAKDVARPSLDHYVEERRDADRRAIAGVERAADAAWLAGLAGRYRSDGLGELTIAGDVLDAGEWRVRFGRRVDGPTTKLVFLDPPFAGGELVVADGALVLDYGQARYVFGRR